LTNEGFAIMKSSKFILKKIIKVINRKIGFISICLIATKSYLIQIAKKWSNRGDEVKINNFPLLISMAFMVMNFNLNLIISLN